MPAPVGRRPARTAAAATLLLACAAAAAPPEVVVLRDGFLIQGTVRKEMDFQGGFTVPKAGGFDYVDEGPKLVVFSTHSRQLGEISKDVKLRPEYRSFPNFLPAAGRREPLPVILGVRTPMGDFDGKWKRSFQLNVVNPINGSRGFATVNQQVTYLDPYTCIVTASTHHWLQGYRTSEMAPDRVRRLLAAHPELAEPDGKCDPGKRVAIARFLKDVGWLYSAQEELARLRKDCPDPAGDAKALVDQFAQELDRAVAERAIAEAEAALAAGRYQYAGRVLDAVPVKTADPKDVLRTTQLMAQHKAAVELYADARRLLRATVEEALGAAGVGAAAAAAGGPVVAVWRTGTPTPGAAALAAAAEVVAAELHPDAAGRVEFFVNLARQAERERAQGQRPTKGPAELLATAVSGWVKGKNGATPEPPLALRLWAAREFVLRYQRTADPIARQNLADAYEAGGMPGLDELAQVISLAPPAEPEDLARPAGAPVPGRAAPPGTVRRKAPGTRHLPGGVDYLLKLPPEYHHGRAYPVVLALPGPGMDADAVLRALATEADRRGYILAAPEWADFFTKGWEWKGEDHDYVTAVLRDVVRHFAVDNDRVFLFGAGLDGGNMALDVGLSHPDLFAAVAVMGSNPLWAGFGREYWPNAQRLPVFVVTGVQADVANANLRKVFANWMPRGFPAVHVLYKGRFLEWFPAEVPVIFDWMGRKKRPHGTAVLPGVDVTVPLPYQTMRPDDNRFYWLGAGQIAPANLAANVPPGRNVIPARIGGDIRPGNVLALTTFSVRVVTVWLGRDMIDWAKPVHVQLNGQAAPRTAPDGKPWRPRVLEPDLGVLMEDYWERGDRKMLFLAKLEFLSAN